MAISAVFKFTLYLMQEHTPIGFTSFPNVDEIKEYIITTGLGRLYPISELSVKKFLLMKDIIFLSRANVLERRRNYGLPSAQLAA